MVTIISNNPEATADLGEQWGRAAKSGWLIGLSGDLGAGKTQFVKGIARGLGITGRISSPTFGLVNEIEGGRLPFWHIDLYRLNGWDEIASAGIDEYLLDVPGVVVVEWVERWLEGERAKAFLDHSTVFFRWVRIEILSETERQFTYEDFSA
jgi:tRNA threonylcarbamoyladenosine biosynthesis protein TsaE